MKFRFRCILLLDLLRTLSITFRYSRIDLGVLDSRWWGKTWKPKGKKCPPQMFFSQDLQR